MRAFWILTRLRLNDVLRSRSSTAFLLGLPPVLFLLAGLVFGNGHPFERRTVILVGDGAGTERLARQIARHDELRVERAAGRSTALVRLGSRMASAVLLRERPGRHRLLVGPRETLFGRGLAEVLSDHRTTVILETVDIPDSGYVQYLFGGLLTFGVMLAGLFGMGYAMVRFRQSLFLKKLATTPLPRATFVAAQIAARALLVLAQVVLVIGVAVLIFDVPVSLSAFLWLLVASVLGLLTFMGAGFALACIVRTEDLVVDVISAVNLPLVLLSEMFFPVRDLSWPLPALSAALPSTQMVRLVRAIVLEGTADAQALGILAAWTAATFALSLAVFRWR